MRPALSGIDLKSGDLVVLIDGGRNERPALAMWGQVREVWNTPDDGVNFTMKVDSQAREMINMLKEAKLMSRQQWLTLPGAVYSFSDYRITAVPSSGIDIPALLSSPPPAFLQNLHAQHQQQLCNNSGPDEPASPRLNAAPSKKRKGGKQAGGRAGSRGQLKKPQKSIRQLGLKKGGGGGKPSKKPPPRHGKGRS